MNYPIGTVPHSHLNQVKLGCWLAGKRFKAFYNNLVQYWTLSNLTKLPQKNEDYSSIFSISGCVVKDWNLTDSHHFSMLVIRVPILMKCILGAIFLLILQLD